MVNNIVATDETKNKNPQEEHQLKLEHQKKLDDLCTGVYNILDNPKVAEACKDGPLLIKEHPTKLNLYLGYAVNILGRKVLCFFDSFEHEKISDEMRNCIISRGYLGFVEDRLMRRFEIGSYEELSTIVESVLSGKHTKENTNKTGEELKETLK